MERLRLGLPVYDVFERRIGEIERIRSCCFEVTTETSKVAIVPEGIFNVRDLDLTLICEAARVPAYYCPIHNPDGGGAALEGLGEVARSSGFK